MRSFFTPLVHHCTLEGTSLSPPEETRAKLKVCLVGADTGCKTRVVRKHVIDPFDDRFILTVGAKVSKKSLRFGAARANLPTHVDLLVWDILSDGSLGELLRSEYVYGARGILAVADMTRRPTLDDLDFWVSAVEKETGPVPIAIVGANWDRTEQLQVTEEDVASVGKRHHAPCFFEPSESGDAVEAAFRYLADAVVKSSFGPRTDRDHKKGKVPHPG